MKTQYWKMHEFPFIHWTSYNPDKKEIRWAVVDDFGNLAAVQEDQFMDHYIHALCDYYIMDMRIFTTEIGTWH